jgi:hypothetical protein
MRYSRKNFWLLCGLGTAALIAAHLLPHAVRGSGPWSIPALGFGGLMALGTCLFGLSYAAMDDIQKQNMKSDWYWGSVIGLAVLCGVVFPYALFGSGAEDISAFLHGADKAQTPKGHFFSGVIASMGPMTLGYFVIYLFRRLREMK